MVERQVPVAARRRSAVPSGLAMVLVLVGGCQTTTPSPPAPAPRLLDAARFDLPEDCVVTSGRTYRMSYTIGIDGRTGSLGAITPPDAPACLQAALATWVDSFRYVPPRADRGGRN